MEFNKNELLNEVMVNFYNTFALTLDTDDFVPPKYNDKICKIIFREMKKKMRSVNREYKKIIKAEKEKTVKRFKKNKTRKIVVKSQ